MITGTLTFDFDITVDNEKKLQELTTLILRTGNALDGVDHCFEVDSNIEDTSD